MVLGGKIFEEKGKVTGISVKSVEPEGIHLEENFASEVRGFGRGVSGRNIGTMNDVQAPSGIISGTGQGLFTSEGGDSVMWKCNRLGKSEGGKLKSVFIIQYMTTSQKLSWMNNLIVVEEVISDQKTMEASGTAYEWK